MQKAIRFALLLACGALLGVTNCGEGCVLGATGLLVEPAGTVYVGQWKRLAVTLPSSATYTFDDITFSVTGEGGGAISPSKDETFSKSAPSIMLLAGHKPGTYALRATVNGVVASEQPFTLVSDWPVDGGEDGGEDGPSFWFSNVDEPFFEDAGYAWGGSPDSVQNYNLKPALGTRRVAVVLVDFKDKKYPSGSGATLQKFWLDNLVNGVNDPNVGNNVSVKRYYEELSHGLFSVSAKAFGPFTLPGTYASYLGAERCVPQPFAQAAITAADDAIDYREFDSIVVVSPASSIQNDKYAWPCASIGRWDFTSGEGAIARGVISMPNEWEQVDCRRAYQTLAHELGHNLRLRDQYKPAVGAGVNLYCSDASGNAFNFGTGARNIGQWDLMEFDGFVPHLSLAHRLQLGWASPADIVRMDPLKNPGPAEVSLSPAELGVPVNGRKLGVEFRLSDGWNEYVEFRKGQAGAVGDAHAQGLFGPNAPGRVVATDYQLTPDSTRPQVMLLPAVSRPQDGNPFLDSAGEEFLDTDAPSQKSLRVHLDSTPSSDEAKLQLAYSAFQPDPSIRPWPASGPHAFQSPDIQVVNAKSEADPAWANVPWAGNPNTVIATVRNTGNMDAEGVVVHFAVKSYNAGSEGNIQLLESDIHDIPAGTAVQFKTTWDAPAQGHWCVIATVVPWSKPVDGGTLNEVTGANNVAQSNYDRFYSGVASPAERVIREVVVGNPLDQAARVYFTVAQSNPEYRAYLEHRWLYLQPHENRSVRAMFEYAGPTDVLGGRSVNEVSLTGWVVQRPQDAEQAHEEGQNLLIGGANLTVLVGLKTTVGELKQERSSRGVQVSGVVRVLRSGEPVTAGKVVVRGDTGVPPFVYGTADVSPDGTFKAELPGSGWKRLRAYYVADGPNADSESEELSL